MGSGAVKHDTTDFKPMDMFLKSLTEVSKFKGQSNIFNTASASTQPDKAYLQRKRTSVFHKAFDKKELEDFKAPEYPKTEEQLSKLTSLFKESFLTKTLEEKQHTVLAKAMFSRNYKQGEQIIRYGDMGQDYFVLIKGKVQVTVYKPGTDRNDPDLSDKVLFTKYLEVDSQSEKIGEQMIGFGEIALLQNDRRTASIDAVSDCETWVLTGDVFKMIIAVQAIKRRNISLEYLNQVDLFSGLEQYAKLKLIDGLEVVHANLGQYVFKQGE